MRELLRAERHISQRHARTPSRNTDCASCATTASRPDARIIAEALRDPSRFAEIFDRHWSALHAFCTSRMGAAGEDLAAETFRLAFDRRARYDQRYDDARPWLYGIATNLIRQYFRAAQRRERTEERSAALSLRARREEALSGLERQLLGPELASALGSLSPA